jgi:uncharacterized protein YndB with AHSA1/START domain
MVAIEHEIKISATPQRIFEALSRRDALSDWYAGRVAGDGKEWRLEHSDGPTFRWKVIEAVSPRRIVWQCVEGPGDSVGTQASFTLLPQDAGRTLVEFAHSGWPGTHGNYRKCNTLWAILLHHLKEYAGSSSAAIPNR